jgi:hypothetical protein
MNFRYLLSVGAGATLASVLAVGLAAPAQAHNSSAHYQSTLTGVTPTVAGVSVTVASSGDYIELTNTSPVAVVVEGYQHEPYLRIGPEGTFQNTKSTATYLNKEATIDSIPDNADAKAAPVWQKVSDKPTARWHDHRIHWMGNGMPPNVAKDPTKGQVIKNWSVPALAADTPFAISGELRWLPEKPTNLWWVALFVGVLVLILAVVLLGVRRRVRVAGTDTDESEPDILMADR